MSTVQEKLKIKEGYKVLLLNSPLDQKILFPDGDKIKIVTKPENGCDFVLLFVRSCADVANDYGTALKTLKEDGILWIAYPKQSSGIKTDLNRDNGWEPLYKAGFGPVSQIAVDSTWSALRFRSESKVRRKSDSVILKRK